MDNRYQNEHQAGPTVQGQRELLPGRPKDMEHADHNGQDQRQHEEQQQPEGGFVEQDGARPGPVVRDNLQARCATQQSRQPRTIVRREAVAARPRHRQNREYT
jgi:hypothetical protein